jgi:hypothetical protein
VSTNVSGLAPVPDAAPWLRFGCVLGRHAACVVTRAEEARVAPARGGGCSSSAFEDSSTAFNDSSCGFDDSSWPRMPTARSRLRWTGRRAASLLAWQ